MSRAALILTAALLASCAARPEQPAAQAEAPRDSAPAVAPAPARPPASTESVVGRSLENRPIIARTIGVGPLRVFLVAGLHHEHAAVSDAIEPILGALDTRDVARLATIRAIPDANPDGAVAGSRSNARDIDVDRNFPAASFEPDGGAPGRRYGPSPLTEPESRAVHDAFHAFDPDLVIVLDIARAGPYIAWSPAELDDAARAAAGAAQRIRPRTRLLPNTGLAPGSLASFAGDDLRIPTVTIALPFNRPDRTAIDAVVAGIEAAIRESAE